MFIKFCMCFLGITISYLLNGIAMETLNNIFGEKMSTFFLFMVLIPAVFSLLFAKGALTLRVWFSSLDAPIDKVRQNAKVPQRYYFLCSLFMMAAMLCTYAALGYLTFPTLTILKSLKPIPVLLCGMFGKKKVYSIYRLFSTLLIVAGAIGFIYQKYGLKGEPIDTPFYGFGCFLVVGSLLLDGLLAGIQERMRVTYYLDAHVLMYHINIYSALMLFIVVVVSGELFKFISFVSRKPIAIYYLFFLSLSSAMGQHFAFYTIKTFGTLPCTIITTIRKLFSVLTSVLLFSHIMSYEMWTSVCLVFIGLAIDISAQHKSRKLRYVSSDQSRCSRILTL